MKKTSHVILSLLIATLAMNFATAQELTPQLNVDATTMVKSQKKEQLQRLIADLSKQLAELEGTGVVQSTETSSVTEAKEVPVEQTKPQQWSVPVQVERVPETHIKVYRLKNASASGVLTTLYDLFPELEKANNDEVRVASEHRTNSIIILGDEEIHKTFGGMITELDISTDETEETVATLLTPRTIAEIDAALERKLAYAVKGYEVAKAAFEVGAKNATARNEAAVRFQMHQAKTELLKWRFDHSDVAAKAELSKEVLKSMELSIKAAQNEVEAAMAEASGGGIVSVIESQTKLEDAVIQQLKFMNLK